MLSNYYVESSGCIFNKKLNRYMTQKPCRAGYMRVWLTCDDGKRRAFSVHRLIASYYLPNPEDKPDVNHIDGNKSNNSIENLEWVTKSENQLHSRRVLKNKGRARKQDRIDAIKFLYKNGFTQEKIASAFEISHPRVVKILKLYK